MQGSYLTLCGSTVADQTHIFTAFVFLTGSTPTRNTAAGQIERWNSLCVICIMCSRSVRHWLHLITLKPWVNLCTSWTVCMEVLPEQKQNEHFLVSCLLVFGSGVKTWPCYHQEVEPGHSFREQKPDKKWKKGLSEWDWIQFLVVVTEQMFWSAILLRTTGPSLPKPLKLCPD